MSPKVQGDRKALVASADAKSLLIIKSLTAYHCQGRITFAVPPCFTVPRALCGIPSYSRQLTYAHTSQNTPPRAFDCALRGPFGGLSPARFSAPRTLCEGMTALISASTVSYEITEILAVLPAGVKQIRIWKHGKNNPLPNAASEGFPMFSPCCFLIVYRLDKRLRSA